MARLQGNSADAGFRNFVTENEFNRNLTVRNDRFAILPSKIRSSPKSCYARLRLIPMLSEIARLLKRYINLFIIKL